MSTLADGPLIIPINQVRQLIADSYWWRRIADEQSPWSDETALAHTHIDALPLPPTDDVYNASELTALRPFAIVWNSSGDGLEINVITPTSCCAVPKGHVVVQLEIPVPADLTNDDNALGEHLTKIIGKVIWTGDDTKPGILDLAGPPDRIHIRRILVGPYERVSEKDRSDLGDFVVCELDVYWGQDG